MKKEANIVEKDRHAWVKVDAQLCALLWNSLDPQLFPAYQSYETCLIFGTRKRQSTTMIFNDEVVSSPVNTEKQNLDITTFVGIINSLQKEFQSSISTTTTAQESKRDNFFTVMTLVNLHPELDHVQIRFLVVHLFSH